MGVKARTVSFTLSASIIVGITLFLLWVFKVIDTRTISIFLIFVGWGVTLLVTGFYGLFAPWYKQASGRYIFSLLASIAAVLSNSMVRILFPGQDWSTWTGIVLFIGFIITMIAMGVGIFNAQIRHTRIEKRLRHGSRTTDDV